MEWGVTRTQETNGYPFLSDTWNKDVLITTDLHSPAHQEPNPPIHLGGPDQTDISK